MSHIMLFTTMSTNSKRIIPKGIKLILYGFTFSEVSPLPTLQMNKKSGLGLTFSDSFATLYVKVPHLVLNIQQRLNKNMS